MYTRKIIKKLEDINGNEITNMGASWVTRPYELENLLHLAAHVYWDNPAITGFLFLEYSVDSARDKTPIDKWEVYNGVELDGTFDSMMFLDSNVPVSSYRLRFTHNAGAGSLQARILTKP